MMKKGIIIACIILTIGIIINTNDGHELNNKIDSNRIIAYVNNKRTGEIPGKNDGYIVDKIECTNDAVGTWNYDEWGIVITDLSNSNTRCSVYFKSENYGPTFVSANSGDTHKGIVYLNPTNLYDYCNEEITNLNVNSNGTPTEIKDGCMKWYVYDDSGTNYKMILAHNTTARIRWNDSNKNVSYNQSNVKNEVELLSEPVSNGGYGWKVTAEVLSAEKIVEITDGPSSWNKNDVNTWYRVGPKNQTNYEYLSCQQLVVQRSYHWLFDYMEKSVTYNALYDDNYKYNYYNSNVSIENDYTRAYWTTTVVGTAGNGNNIWYFDRNGMLYYGTANNTRVGIRPAIEVRKSLFN